MNCNLTKKIFKDNLFILKNENIQMIEFLIHKIYSFFYSKGCNEIEEKVRLWFLTPNPILGNLPPIHLLILNKLDKLKSMIFNQINNNFNDCDEEKYVESIINVIINKKIEKSKMIAFFYLLENNLYNHIPFFNIDFNVKKNLFESKKIEIYIDKLIKSGNIYLITINDVEYYFIKNKTNSVEINYSKQTKKYILKLLEGIMKDESIEIK